MPITISQVKDQRPVFQPHACNHWPRTIVRHPSGPLLRDFLKTILFYKPVDLFLHLISFILSHLIVLISSFGSLRSPSLSRHIEAFVARWRILSLYPPCFRWCRECMPFRIRCKIFWPIRIRVIFTLILLIWRGGLFRYVFSSCWGFVGFSRICCFWV